jgi:uncharacterized protein (DUF362 family)
MTRENPRREISRADFLRLASGAGGLLLAAPLLQACQRLGMIEPTETPRPAPTETRSPTATAEPTASPSASPAPTSTATASPTATLTPTAPTSTPTTVPTATVGPFPTPAPGAATVALVRTNDRAEGVRRAIELLGINPVAQKTVLVKPNLNSIDPAPASTHPDVLRATIVKLQEMGAGRITVGDRSGQGDAGHIMKSIGGLDMARELGFDFVDFGGLGRGDWVMITPPDTRWKSDRYPLGPGFPIARPVLEAGAVVSVCCLKTHANGGGITMSLKNSVGMVAVRLPGDEHAYNFMIHILHDGNTPRKIVEINLAYEPALIVLDGVDAFTSGGPAVGNKVSPGVVMAATDRVAIDALGVAILKMYGANLGRISKVYQMFHAIKLGLGVDSPDKIHIVTGDEESARFAQELRGYLMDKWV